MEDNPKPIVDYTADEWGVAAETLQSNGRDFLDRRWRYKREAAEVLSNDIRLYRSDEGRPYGALWLPNQALPFWESTFRTAAQRERHFRRDVAVFDIHLTQGLPLYYGGIVHKFFCVLQPGVYIGADTGWFDSKDGADAEPGGRREAQRLRLVYGSEGPMIYTDEYLPKTGLIRHHLDNPPPFYSNGISIRLSEYYASSTYRHPRFGELQAQMLRLAKARTLYVRWDRFAVPIARWLSRLAAALRKGPNTNPWWKAAEPKS